LRGLERNFFISWAGGTVWLSERPVLGSPSVVVRFEKLDTSARRPIEVLTPNLETFK
jgi:hypothetical protein